MSSGWVLNITADTSGRILAIKLDIIRYFTRPKIASLFLSDWLVARLKSLLGLSGLGRD